MKIRTQFLAAFALLTCLLAGFTINAPARPREPWPPLPEFAPVLFHESFDAIYSYRMTNAQWTIPNYGILVESWSGYALQRSGKVTPFSVPAVDRSGHTNLAATGALRFWLKPYWTSDPDGNGPGTDVSLAELGLRGGQEVLPIWSLEISRDGSTVSLIHQTDDGPMPVLKAAIRWQAGEWHQVALNYESKATALYLDGALASEGPGLMAVPLKAAELVIGSAHTGERALEGEVEEVCTFSRPLTVGFHYEALKRRAALGPITPEEDQTAAEWRARLRAEREATARNQGPPMLRLLGSTPECITNTPVFITNVCSILDTNAGWTVTFDVQGSWDGSTNALYDVFMTQYLAGNSITNSQWVWLERGPSCSTYQYTNQPEQMAFYVVGTPLDSDGDGLTDAFESLVTHTDPHASDLPVILFQPLSQTVEQGDTVTFTMAAQAASPLGYQWRLGTNTLAGETNSSLVLPAVQFAQAGDYSVTVSSAAALSILSSNAVLTVVNPANWPVVTLAGPRQDYTFKSGTTYYVGSRVELYGTSTIEGGAVLKPDWYYPDSTLAIMGSLVCKTEDAYFPAFVTSVDDDTVGDALWFSSGAPFAASNGAPYLDLSQASDATPALNNLRIRFADQAVVSPASKTLDVWHCQFVQCATGIVASAGASVSLHSVLFGACGSVIAGTTNFTAVSGEHVTAEATDFWTEGPPATIAFTNSIVMGAVASGPTLVTEHAAINPGASVFQPTGSGHYYLANTSPYRQAGTTNVSPRLLAELRQRTTQPPLAFPAMMQIAGDLTLGPQVARYSNGTPDYGYHYPALDYTVAWLTNWGTITVLPGTAIGFRDEYSPAHGRWSLWGFDLREGSTFTSHGMPAKPIAFTDVQLVQEQPTWACFSSFLPDFWPNNEDKPAPVLDFRFCHFYAHSSWYHFWSGYEETCTYLQSPDSLMNWTLRDCALHGGRVNLGSPDDGWFFGAPMDWFYGAGTVSWVNNLFDTVAVSLDPTYYWYLAVTNCDLAFEARQNLFRAGQWFFISPIPSSAGNWALHDNLFDQVNLVQDTNAPLDFGYNAYWPLTASELQWAAAEWTAFHWWDWYGYPLDVPNTSQFNAAANGGGASELVLIAAPPYQAGPLGKFYLQSTTALHQAGSRTAGEAGMAQYTTSTNLAKENASLPVSIGLHYVAAANDAPLDSDGDGVPDYVEDSNGNGAVDEHETSPSLVQTVTGIYDATNAVYDDVDLSGNGLVGRIKKALGVNPLDANNPLTLTQIITGDEPQFVTFETPISYATLTNIGGLQLNMNGIEATLQSCYAATNGYSLLSWNTTYDPFGLHYLQAQFRLAGAEYGARVLAGVGGVIPFDSTNVLRFFEGDSLFGETGAYLDAKLAAPDATYVIELYDPSTTPATLIKAITNSTANGLIREDWDLTCQDGTNVFAGDEVDAAFNVTLRAAGTGTPLATGQPTKRLTKLTTTEQGNGFDVVYMYTPTNSGLASSYSSGAVAAGMQSVVDVLMQPSWPWDPYFSSFNLYSWSGGPGLPGYVTSRAAITNYLFPSMADGVTKNFYCHTHGNTNRLGNAAGTAWIWASEIANLLTNRYVAPDPRKPGQGGLRVSNPYRFVFLDACHTAAGPNWRRAFGIMPIWATNQSRLYGLGPQAYVGWAREALDQLGGYYDTNGVMDLDRSTTKASAYTATLQLFFLDWMNGASLYECIKVASDTNAVACPLPVPEVTIFTIGQPFTSIPFTCTNNWPSDIYVIGHSGLTRNGLKDNQDGFYGAPRNGQ